MSETAEVSAAELARKLQSREPLFILDVRNEEDYEEWRTEGAEPLPQLNLPYFVVLEDEDGELAKLPQEAMQGRQVVVVCAKGGASDYVAELLRQRGVPAVNLAGGMVAWRAHLDAGNASGGAGDA